MGTVKSLMPAHVLSNAFNHLPEMGTMGSHFRACCLLETTTNRFYIRTVPSLPNESSWPVRRTVAQNTHNTQNPKIEGQRPMAFS
jgi:hypothetical protein